MKTLILILPIITYNVICFNAAAAPDKHMTAPDAVDMKGSRVNTSKGALIKSEECSLVFQSGAGIAPLLPRIKEAKSSDVLAAAILAGDLSQTKAVLTANPGLFVKVLDVSLPDQNGGENLWSFYPLDLAVATNNLSMVKEFFRLSDSLCPNTTCAPTFAPNNATLVEVAAIYEGDASMVDYLIGKVIPPSWCSVHSDFEVCKPLATRATHFGSPMHYAAMTGKSDVVRLLAQKYGVDVNTLSRYYKVTPLLCVSEKSDYQMAKTLLDLGANPSIASHFNYDLTPLERALHGNDISMFSLLLQYKANPNQTFYTFDESPLTSATDQKNYDAIEILLANGVDVEYRAPGYKNNYLSALDITATHEDLKAAAILLKANAQINSQNKFGKHVLINYVKEVYYPLNKTVLQFLIQNNASKTLKDNGGKNAYDYARDRGAEADVLAILKP